MKTSFINALTIALALASFGASAQDKFTISGGGGAKNGSTYSAMLGDLATFCSDTLPMEEVQSSGGVANLEALRTNKVKAAIVPTDVLLAAKADNATSVANIKTLVSLHPEEVHLIARADTKTEGGVNIPLIGNAGGNKVKFDQPEDLKGRPVGAVGGTVRTAQILNSYLHIGWIVKDYLSTDAMMKALTSGEVDAVMVVAGAPSAAVAKLDNRFKLLAIRGNSDTAAVYVPTKVQYEKLNGGRAVDTLSTQALLVTRTFKSPEMMASLGAFRQCFVDSLPKIQDKDGTHPKWQDVNPTDKGRWEWYDLPKPTAAAAAAPAPVAAPAKKK